MNKPKYLSKSNINFKEDYPIGKSRSLFFKSPKNTEKIELYFDEYGKLICMSILYLGKYGSLMETEYHFDGLLEEEKKGGNSLPETL